MKLNQSLEVVNNEKGMVLAVVIMLIAVLVLLGATAIFTTNTDMKISGNYKVGSQAFHNADAGVETVLEYLRKNHITYPTSTAAPTTITISCPTGFNFNTSVPINYISANRYKFQISGTGANNASKTIEVYFNRTPLYPQTADGAVAMYGGGPAVQFKTGGGGGYAIDGHDYPVPTNSSCNGSACNTTALSTTTNPPVPGLFTIMTPTLTGDVAAHLGGVPTQAIGASRQDAYDNFADYVVANNLYQSTLGTRANPAVTLIPNGTTLNGTGNGAGIIIVNEGGALQINGNFEFEGLIILRGTGRIFGTGTGNVFGSVITVDHTSKLIDLTGGINLYYSTAALANLSNIDSVHSVKRLAWRNISN